MHALSRGNLWRGRPARRSAAWNDRVTVDVSSGSPSFVANTKSPSLPPSTRRDAFLELTRPMEPQRPPRPIQIEGALRPVRLGLGHCPHPAAEGGRTVTLPPWSLV